MLAHNIKNQPLHKNMHRNTCLFISSSDNTFDVFQIMESQFLKMLPTDSFQAYVGLNTYTAKVPFKTVWAKQSSWSEELYLQIIQLPQSIQLIILILDDFWLHQKITREYICNCIDLFERLRADYLRLKPVERSLPVKLYRNIKSSFVANTDAEQLSLNEPYYSSLQIALWRREYLESRLASKCNIWDFEHITPTSSRHFAVTKKNIYYEHLVEKGKWFPYAPEVMGIKSKTNFVSRGFHVNLTKRHMHLQQLKFALIGYTCFRIRRIIKTYQNTKS